ncbi:haloacid dehalogenase [Paecilomyces variotii]|uniref:Haloacid dehalogenase n=1 Tax=Byssochlamys spectabilis TaxID=264951 RepID=A0A443HMK7_BYSSP|nr:haloacid dehalogenase [Paecilomyces variotii]KAJ9353646.1 hypothetical protein DTO280E4_7239 [Paecilomyces variotii]RWQ93068.1 haloacid dehalogenase [Paecilomyces variotii]
MTTRPPHTLNPDTIEALVFDLMGTCCDWKSGILSTLARTPSLQALSDNDRSRLADDWRSGFFNEIHAQFEAGAPPEDIDVTHRRVLDRILAQRRLDAMTEDERRALVGRWHEQLAWPDTINAIERLKEKFKVVVLANGTTRLQLDIVKSSGIPFHTLFSSQLLQLTKPDPAIYYKAFELLQIPPEKSIMVAAHAYDLRAAKKVGMKTVYIRRDTEDVDEDMDRIRKEVDVFLEGSAHDRGPMEKLADLLL